MARLELQILLPVAALALVFVGYCYVQLARRPAKLLPKIAWAFIIIASVPFGAVLYLVLGRGERPVGDSDPVDPVHAVTPARIATPVPSGPVIRTYGLTKVFRDNVGLHAVDLSVPSRGVYGLVGPNGAGKTTLMNLLAGLRRADSGQIGTAARVTLCPDTPAFEPWLTATETVRLFGAPTGLEAARALAVTGLTSARDRRVGGFSRGMTQRLGLAVALASGAEVLLLDEPTSALDPKGRAEILSLITGLGRDRAVMVSSHVLADIQRVADTVGVLREGRLVYQGPVRDLIDRHTRPSWRIELRSKVDELTERLRSKDWVVAVEREATGLRVDTVSVSAGETLLTGEIAAVGVELVAINPVGADLETVFLNLVGGAA